MPTKVELDFTRYHKHAELVEALNRLATAHPDLARVYSIGRSLEGRDQWLIEITNQATGPAADKPAYHINGNHHAGEVTGSSVALYTAWYLLSRYGDDPEVTDLLDTRAFYILPRIAVDGSEKYLTTPYMIRSSVRLYPDSEAETKDGLYPEDINGDGKILTMRVRDDSGEWKVSDGDPRLMVKRRPDEDGGTYYRLYTEGLIRNRKEGPFTAAPNRWGVDFNRNYPTNWAPEPRQRGAGSFPFSEPEIHNLARFILEHPNIAGAMSYHTSGGVILRPFATQSDEKFPPKDLAAYKAIGQRGEEITGYPCWQIWERFTANKGRPEVGSFPEWVYEDLGVLAYEIELWDMNAQAGVPKRDFKGLIELTDKEREEEGLKFLQWNDRELGGRGFTDWTPFDHPQLGAVEIGGWDPKFVRQNPPPHLLPGECHKCARFTLRHAAASPRLKLAEVKAERVGAAGGGASLWKLAVTAENEGYLPTAVTEMAVNNRRAKPVTARIALTAGAELVFGREKEDLGHLGGRVAAGGAFGGGAVPDNQKMVTWLVKAQTGGAATVTVESPRAGRVTREVPLS
ncbi:MAG: M14 family metallopeptidase [Bacillota bacterium]